MFKKFLMRVRGFLNQPIEKQLMVLLIIVVIILLLTLTEYISVLTENIISKRKSLVLDPFAGSNTTGYVASKLGRKWLSIEKDLNYIKGSNGWFK